MRYNCKSIPVTKLVPSKKGFVTSLCDSCCTRDCENNIEKRQVSMLGIVKTMKLLVKSNDPYIVINCDGYTNKK